MKTQYKNTADEYARRVNRITGQDDGMDYITNYAGAFDTQEASLCRIDYATRDQATRRRPPFSAGDHYLPLLKIQR